MVSKLRKLVTKQTQGWSPAPAGGSRKRKQVARGDELMNNDGMYIKGGNGSKIPIPKGTKTRVETRQ